MESVCILDLDFQFGGSIFGSASAAKHARLSILSIKRSDVQHPGLQLDALVPYRRSTPVSVHSCLNF